MGVRILPPSGVLIEPPAPSTQGIMSGVQQVMGATLAVDEHPISVLNWQVDDVVNAADDAVSAGNARAAAVSSEIQAAAKTVNAPTARETWRVAVRFVCAGEQVGQQELTLEARVHDEGGASVLARALTMPVARLTIPRGYELADASTGSVEFVPAAGEVPFRAVAKVAVDHAVSEPESSGGIDYTVQATPIMLVDGAPFPAKRPWEFSSRVRSTDMTMVAAALQKVMEQQITSSFPQVDVVSVVFSEDCSTATIDLEHRPFPTGEQPRLIPKVNALPGGLVLGMFPPGWTHVEGVMAADEARHVWAVSKALTEELARVSTGIRQDAGLPPLEPVAPDESVVGALARVCEIAALNGSTRPTVAHDRLMELLGRRRCSEMLYPRQKRHGNDSVAKLASIFVHGAQRSVMAGRHSALLSKDATGVTVGLVVYRVDTFSMDYEVSMSVILHA